MHSSRMPYCPLQQPSLLLLMLPLLCTPHTMHVPCHVCPTCGQTDACENITFPQLLLWTVKCRVVISVLHDFVTTIEKHDSLYVSELIRSILTFQRLKDKFWNFIFYKFIFIFGVMNVQNMDEVICWSAWFTILGFLHLFSQLCKDRFEYVSTWTSCDTNKHKIEHLFYVHCIERSPPIQG